MFVGEGIFMAVCEFIISAWKISHIRFIVCPPSVVLYSLSLYVLFDRRMSEMSNLFVAVIFGKKVDVIWSIIFFVFGHV